MKATGVIVEYNPFHNGHAYHLREARQLANADIVVAVMSGNFLQRGEPALVSKWYRTKMALLNGVDIVIELPYRFAVQKAEYFAHGAISLLDALGCESVCFGSESGDLSDFLQTIDFLEQNGPLLDERIREAVGTGVSYPKAASLAFQQLPHADQHLDLSKPNNILGLEYIKSIRQINSSIKPLTVMRKSADYHDQYFSSATIASATSIRKAIFSEQTNRSEINQYIPESTLLLLTDYVQHYQLFHRWENYWSYLQFRLLHISPEELRGIYEVEEGLEYRLLSAALESASFQEFMEKVKTKRYTWTRLQRLCVHILTNTKKSEIKQLAEQPAYLRLLGMNSKGKAYLNEQKKNFKLPLVSKLSAFKDKEILFDVKAARIYSLAVPGHRKTDMIQQEYKQPPIYIE